MSKKNLLNEGTVRRFMKLAEIEALNRTVCQKNEGDYKKDEKLEEEADMMADMEDDPDGMRHDGMMEEEADMSDDMDGMIDDPTDDFEPKWISDDEDMPEPEGDMDDGDGWKTKRAKKMDMEMDMEGPAPAGGLDPEVFLKEMIKDAVMDALKQLVDDGVR